MNLQDQISLILELAVTNITTAIRGNLTTDEKSKLRIQFDSELSWQCGDINLGQHTDTLENNKLNEE